MFEVPPEDGARTKLFDRELQFRESHTTEPETRKKLLTEGLKKRIFYRLDYMHTNLVCHDSRPWRDSEIGNFLERLVSVSLSIVGA